MTNTHRKTTNRTTAKIAAVGAFGIGAAIAFPGLAAAQETAPESPTASLENLAGEDGSLEEGSVEGALGTDIEADLGSLALNLNLDAETPTPGSVEFGSLGVSPNTGSGLVDGDSGSGSSEDDATEETGDSGSLGSLTEGSADDGTTEETGEAGETGSLGSSDDATEETDETGTVDSGSLAGLSSGAEEDPDAGETTDDTTGTTTGSLG